MATCGEVDAAGLSAFDLRSGTTIAEVDLDQLVAAAEIIRKTHPLSDYPPIDRDLNVVFDEAVRWSDVDTIVRAASAELLESLDLTEEYRDAERLGAGKKSLLFSVRLRSPDETLTNEKADGVREAIVAKLASELGGELRA